MKAFLKEYGISILAFVALSFLIWAFFFDGLATLVASVTLNQSLGALVLIVGIIVFLFTRKLISSIKWWKVSSTWRKDIKVGDVAYVSTHDGHEDAEIIDVEDEHVTVKFRVHKSRIYKPY